MPPIEFCRPAHPAARAAIIRRMLSIQLFKGGALLREILTDEPRLTVGRDIHASIVLEDPDKRISRQHAAIERRHGVPCLIVHSRVNPVLVDGCVMHAGQTIELAEGARVTISPYEMVVTSDDRPGAVVAPATAPESLAAGATRLRRVAEALQPAAVHASSPDPSPAEPAAGSAAVHAPQQPPSGLDDGLERATRAFLRGLGLGHLDVPGDEQAFFLERAGVMMQCVAEVLVPMLAGRARLRDGLSLADGEDASRNPLFGHASPAEALRFLIDPSARAGSGPDPMQALREATAALIAHQEASLDAARGALTGLLQALDPGAFDSAAARAAGPLGLMRRARAWQAYVDAHAAMVQQAALDPDALLRRDFAPAYLQRLARQDD
jgi:predicted component of type VI protein secretion system